MKIHMKFVTQPKIERGTKMKMIKNNTLYILIAYILLTSLMACGAPQSKFRGIENTPLTQLKPLHVDPNEVKNMSDDEFDAYMRRLRKYNAYVRDTAYTNGYYGYSEKQWVNDKDGGPPVPAMNDNTKNNNSRNSRKNQREKTLSEETLNSITNETGRVIRGTFRTTGYELRRSIEQSIRDVFR